MMKKARKSDQTRKRILDAAAKEFIEKGFEGVSVSQVANRARVSKQLVHHHFAGKEELFASVHEARFRPSSSWDDTADDKPRDLIAERFRKRAKNIDYLRVLTWEAASIRKGPVPGEKERRERIAQYATKLRLLQAQGKLPRDMDYRFIHLTILALASYPLAFNQITRLVTGKSGTDPKFQREWMKHLRKVTERLFLDHRAPA